MIGRRGVTLVELLTVLVLVGIVGTALYQLLVHNQRLYDEQAERVQVNENARAAISILPGEVRELDAGDPAGSDILAMTASSLSYKAMRSLYVLCAPPDPDSLSVTLDAGVFHGVRRVDPVRDSLLLYAEGDPSTRTDDAWLHADVVSAGAGTRCPDGGSGLTLRLAGLAPAALERVTAGAPVRGFEIAEVRLYADGDGARWLGARTRQKKSGAWGLTQPVVGPLTAEGLTLGYFDVAGAYTTDPDRVARVSILVQSRSGRRVRGPGGPDYLLQTLVTHVALRNSPRF
jgi:prepilin-type N-terminal cleavage/methylation domain-containing protein